MKNCRLEIVRALKSECEVVDIRPFVSIESAEISLLLTPNGGNIAILISADGNGGISHYAVFNSLTGDRGSAVLFIEWDDQRVPMVIRCETPESWRWTVPREDWDAAPDSLERIGDVCRELLE